MPFQVTLNIRDTRSAYDQSIDFLLTNLETIPTYNYRYNLSQTKVPNSQILREALLKVQNSIPHSLYLNGIYRYYQPHTNLIKQRIQQINTATQGYTGNFKDSLDLTIQKSVLKEKNGAISTNELNSFVRSISDQVRTLLIRGISDVTYHHNYNIKTKICTLILFEWLRSYILSSNLITLLPLSLDLCSYTNQDLQKGSVFDQLLGSPLSDTLCTTVAGIKCFRTIHNVDAFNILADESYGTISVYWAPHINLNQQLRLLNNFKYAATHIDWTYNVFHVLVFQDDDLFLYYLVKKFFENLTVISSLYSGGQTRNRLWEGVAISNQCFGNDKIMKAKIMSNFWIDAGYHTLFKEGYSFNNLWSIMVNVFKITRYNFNMSEFTLNAITVPSNIIQHLLEVNKQRGYQTWNLLQLQNVDPDISAENVITSVTGVVNYVDLPLSDNVIQNTNVEVGDISIADFSVDLAIPSKSLVDSPFMFVGCGWCVGTDADTWSPDVEAADKARAISSYKNMLTDAQYQIKQLSRFSPSFILKLKSWFENDFLALRRTFRRNTDYAVYYSLCTSSPLLASQNLIIIPQESMFPDNLDGMDKINNSSFKLQNVFMMCMLLGYNVNGYYEWYTKATEDVDNPLPRSCILLGEIKDTNLRAFKQIYRIDESNSIIGSKNTIRFSSYGAEGTGLVKRALIQTLGMSINLTCDIMISDIDQSHFKNSDEGFDDMVEFFTDIFEVMYSSNCTILAIKVNHPSIYLLNQLIKTFSADRGVYNVSFKLGLVYGQNMFTEEAFLFVKRNTSYDHPPVTYFSASSALTSRYENLHAADISIVPPITIKHANMIAGIHDIPREFLTSGTIFYGNVIMEDARTAISLLSHISNKMISWKKNHYENTICFAGRYSEQRSSFTKRNENGYEYYLPTISEFDQAGSFGISNKRTTFSVFSTLSYVTYFNVSSRDFMRALLDPYVVAADLLIVIGGRDLSEISLYPSTIPVDAYEYNFVSLYEDILARYKITYKDVWDWTNALTDRIDPLKNTIAVCNFVVMSPNDSGSNPSAADQVQRIISLIDLVKSVRDTPNHGNLTIIVNYYFGDTILSLLNQYSLPDKISIKTIHGNITTGKISISKYDYVDMLSGDDIADIQQHADQNTVPIKRALLNMDGHIDTALRHLILPDCQAGVGLGVLNEIVQYMQIGP